MFPLVPAGYLVLHSWCQLSGGSEHWTAIHHIHSTVSTACQYRPAIFAWNHIHSSKQNRKVELESFCKYLTFSGFIMWIYWRNWKLNDPFEITFQLLVMDDNDLKIYGVLPLSGREKWDCSIWDDLTPVTGLSEERERHQPGLIITSKTGTRIRQSCDWLLSSQDLPSSSLAIIRDPVAGRTWENGSQTRHTKSLCLA